MPERACTLGEMRGDDPGDDGKGLLTITAIDGQSLQMCVCARCLFNLIQMLSLMAVDLEKLERSGTRRN